MGLEAEENVLSIGDNLRLPCGYECDFYIPALQTLVEVDGYACTLTTQAHVFKDTRSLMQVFARLHTCCAYLLTCVHTHADRPFHYSLDLSAISLGDYQHVSGAFLGSVGNGEADAALHLPGEFVSHTQRRSPLGPTIFKQWVSCISHVYTRMCSLMCDCVGVCVCARAHMCV